MNKSNDNRNSILTKMQKQNGEKEAKNMTLCHTQY